MEELQINLTNDQITEIVLSVLSTQNHRYWLKSCERQKMDSIIGATFVFQKGNFPDKQFVLSFTENGIKFAKNISPMNKIELMQKLMALVQSVMPAGFSNFDEIMSGIEVAAQEEALELAERQKSASMQAYFGAFCKIGQGVPYVFKGDLGDVLRMGNPKKLPALLSGHGHFVSVEPAEENIYDTPNRQIKPKEVYFVDLDPVYQGEYGGKRPCIVIGDNGDRNNTSYFVIPLSHSDKEGIEIEEINDSTNHAVVNKFKPVVSARIYDRLGEISDATYAKLLYELNNCLSVLSPKDGRRRGMLSLDEEELALGQDYVVPHIEDKSPIAVRLKNKEQIDLLPDDELISLTAELIASRFADSVGVEKISYKVKHLKDKTEITISPSLKVIFHKFDVYLSKEGKMLYDTDLSKKYYLMMSEKYDLYPYLIVEDMARSFNQNFHKKVQNTTKEKRQEIVSRLANALRNRLRYFSLVYANPEDLVLNGKKAFDPTKLHIGRVKLRVQDEEEQEKID